MPLWIPPNLASIFQMPPCCKCTEDSTLSKSNIVRNLKKTIYRLPLKVSSIFIPMKLKETSWSFWREKRKLKMHLMKSMKDYRMSNANSNWKSYLYIQHYPLSSNRELLRKPKKDTENVSLPPTLQKLVSPLMESCM